MASPRPSLPLSDGPTPPPLPVALTGHGGGRFIGISPLGLEASHNLPRSSSSPAATSGGGGSPSSASSSSQTRRRAIVRGASFRRGSSPSASNVLPASALAAAAGTVSSSPSCASTASRRSRSAAVAAAAAPPPCRATTAIPGASSCASAVSAAGNGPSSLPVVASVASFVSAAQGGTSLSPSTLSTPTYRRVPASLGERPAPPPLLSMSSFVERGGSAGLAGGGVGGSGSGSGSGGIGGIGAADPRGQPQLNVGLNGDSSLSTTPWRRNLRGAEGGTPMPPTALPPLPSDDLIALSTVASPRSTPEDLARNLPRPRRPEKCPLFCVFYAEFDIVVGPRVCFQCPERFMDRDIAASNDEIHAALEDAFDKIKSPAQQEAENSSIDEEAPVRSSVRANGDASGKGSGEKTGDPTGGGNVNNDEGNAGPEQAAAADRGTDSERAAADANTSEETNSYKAFLEKIHVRPSSLSIFDSTSEYIITGNELADQTICLSSHGFHVLARPTIINDARYERNALLFAVGFVLRRAEDSRPFRPLLSKFASALCSMEVESHFLSSPATRPRLQRILEGILVSLNGRAAECNLMLDDANVLNLRLFRPPKPPASPVPDHVVPVLLRPEWQLQMFDWDLTINWIVPHIDGVKYARLISRSSEVDMEMVQACLRVLKHHGVLAFVDIFRYANVYECTPLATAMLAGRHPRLLNAALHFVSKSALALTGSGSLAGGSAREPTHGAAGGSVVGSHASTRAFGDALDSSEHSAAYPLGSGAATPRMEHNHHNQPPPPPHPSAVAVAGAFMYQENPNQAPAPHAVADADAVADAGIRREGGYGAMDQQHSFSGPARPSYLLGGVRGRFGSSSPILSPVPAPLAPMMGSLASSFPPCAVDLIRPRSVDGYADHQRLALPGGSPPGVIGYGGMPSPEHHPAIHAIAERREQNMLKAALAELYCSCSRDTTFGDMLLKKAMSDESTTSADSGADTDDGDRGTVRRGGDTAEDTEICVSPLGDGVTLEGRGVFSVPTKGGGGSTRPHAHRSDSLDGPPTPDRDRKHRGNGGAGSDGGMRSDHAGARHSRRVDWKLVFERFDHRRLITFGVVYGLIKRVHCYPMAYSLDSDGVGEDDFEEDEFANPEDTGGGPPSATSIGGGGCNEPAALLNSGEEIYVPTAPELHPKPIVSPLLQPQQHASRRQSPLMLSQPDPTSPSALSPLPPQGGGAVGGAELSQPSSANRSSVGPVQSQLRPSLQPQSPTQNKPQTSQSKRDDSRRLARRVASSMDGTRCDDELCCMFQRPLDQLIDAVRSAGQGVIMIKSTCDHPP